MYISASGALNAMFRQDIATNNLANSTTIGFKPVMAGVLQRDPARVEDRLDLPSDRLIERLGGGVLAHATRVRLGQGTIEMTANDLDLAIEGEGFFMVQSLTSQDGDRLRLTRDGRFTLDSEGRLVNQAGLPVLDDRQLPIELDPTRSVTVLETGVVTQSGEPVARLQFVVPDDPAELQPEGESLFRLSADAQRRTRDAGGRVVQGAVEHSGVDELRALMDMQDASRAAQTNLDMVSRYDRLLEQAITRFARVG